MPRRVPSTRMGLFDSTCSVTGLSLAPLPRIAGIALGEDDHGDVRTLGEPVFGISDRAGGLETARGRVRFDGPHAWIAGPVYDAIVQHASDPASFLRARGARVEPARPVGDQHDEGDVFARQASAMRSFGDIPWMREALLECARIAEREAVRRRGSEAPSPGWLERADASWYGIAIGTERRALTSAPDLVAALRAMGPFFFDPDTLRLEACAVVLAVDRGDRRELDLLPFASVENVGRRARLADTADAEALFAIYDDTDPRVVLDEDALLAALPPIGTPLASPGSHVWVATRRARRRRRPARPHASHDATRAHRPRSSRLRADP